MDFYILWILSSIGAFTIVMIVLVVAYIFYSVWREGKEAKQQVQAHVEQRVSEPEPTPAKRDTSSAVHCLDQVDALLKRLETI